MNKEQTHTHTHTNRDKHPLKRRLFLKNSGHIQYISCYVLLAHLVCSPPLPECCTEPLMKSPPYWSVYHLYSKQRKGRVSHRHLYTAPRTQAVSVCVCVCVCVYVCVCLCV